MRTRVIPFVTYIFGVMVLLAATGTGMSQTPTTISITAVPSKFTPDTITLHVGQTTRLDFTNVDGVHAKVEA
jgi:hypothetical protein